MPLSMGLLFIISITFEKPPPLYIYMRTNISLWAVGCGLDGRVWMAWLLEDTSTYYVFPYHTHKLWHYSSAHNLEETWQEGVVTRWYPMSTPDGRRLGHMDRNSETRVAELSGWTGFGRGFGRGLKMLMLMLTLIVDVTNVLPVYQDTYVKFGTGQ
ncbi:hypothetical protein M413DRAFT_6476 [Hebeloma cylindrosporum]|uniref:Uncharacterized protein n=1 Tax=Hebeloma cylindrosporum TaxID=76867 RepID=A0A0C3CZY0_HEBCY|nr:hypothetical protein M413DRAFT_6476 [Hebeloma cylindrosporum h7]